MNYSLVLQSLIPFFFIISFLSINFELSLCAIDPQYSNCSQYIDCGVSTGISYPFWGVNRADYCGEPGFEVKCQNNIPLITSFNVELRILDMSSTIPPTVKVARQDYWRTICPGSLANTAFPESLANTAFNFSLFNYPTSGIRNMTFYYGCNITATQGLSTEQTCNISNTITSVYYSTQNSSVDSSVGCKNEVIVPIFETAAANLEANLTSVSDAIDGGFELELQTDNGRQCHNCDLSGGRCGVNTTNGGGFLCFCQDQPYAAICNLPWFYPSSSGAGRGKITLILGTGISVGVSGIIIVGIICILRTRRVRNDFDVEAFIRNYESLSPKRYSYSNVKKMTKSFKEKIGKGGYGTVYKGELEEGLEVAVKVLIESKGNGEEFINEVASIGRTSHVNVVTLLGFCYEKDKRALIYEYMPNGSLDKFTHDHGSSNENCQLEWNILWEIAVGIARGLEYLHRGCNTRILHFDIKPQNILLDKEFCPKISDFGLAKLCKTKESIVSMLGTRGTAGYIAPEVFSRNFGGVSHKSDVYSYGMLVLEMVGARKNLNSEVSHTSEMFPDYVYKDLELEQDENICGAVLEEEKEIARKMILISLWCIQTIPSDRPSMSKVVEMLEGPLHSLQIAPKPVLFSSAIAAEESVSTSQPSDTS